MTRFVQLYQCLAQLTTGELWALPIMLRLGLIEFLAQSVSRITKLPQPDALPKLIMPPALTADETVANFLCATLTRFARLCEDRGDQTQAAAYRQRAAERSRAIEANAWDGAPITTTAHRLDRRRTRIARSIRSHNRGRPCRVQVIAIVRHRRWPR
jgi:hypothetical protein